MSQNQQPPAPAPQEPVSDDPLASLHRMSTTAGVASQEYVAINLPAVGALLLGLASATVLMSSVLLVLPVLAILFGIAAIRQVNGSNGTQTGRGMAILGMVVAVGMAGYVGVGELQTRSAVQAEQGKIFAKVDELGNALTTKDYRRAASLFSEGFFTKKKLSQEAFADRWQQTVNSGFYGDLQKVETNGRVILHGGAAAGRGADTMLVFHFSKAQSPLRRGAGLRKDDKGEWKFEDLPDLFPTPEEPRQAMPGSPTDVLPR